MTYDPEQFDLRVTEAGDTVLWCRTCDSPIYGAPGDGIGAGHPDDSTLGRLMFIAGDHASLYCGAPAAAVEVIQAYIPEPGELGIGVGRLQEPILERGEDPAGHFSSVVWFPYSAREDAEQAVADSDGRWVLREEVPF